MNVLEALAGLLRRWYITFPGLVLAVVAGYGMWSVTPSDYVRTASQLLLPGDGVLPEGATNQFLYIGGLGPVADVLARAVGGDPVVTGYTEAGVDVQVTRDTSISGPMILLNVSAGSDAEAGEAMDTLVALTSVVLDELQAEQGIDADDRVTVATISADETSTVSQRSRLIPTVAAGVALAFLALVIASLVDGLVTRSRRGHVRLGAPAPDLDDHPLGESDGQPTGAADQDPGGDESGVAVSGDPTLDELRVEGEPHSAPEPQPDEEAAEAPRAARDVAAEPAIPELSGVAEDDDERMDAVGRPSGAARAGVPRRRTSMP